MKSVKREENIAQSLKELCSKRKRILLLIGAEHIQSISKVFEKYDIRVEYIFLTLGYETKGQLPLFPVYHEEILAQRLRNSEKHLLRDMMHRKELSKRRTVYEVLYSFSKNYKPKILFKKEQL